MLHSFRLPVLTFAATVFLGAALLFSIELMIAKMLLPKFGGTPAVWNCCMVFFQGGLLAGYAYAHAVSQRFGLRRQVLLQFLLLVLPLALLLLPIAVPDSWVLPEHAYPAGWLFLLLVRTVGLPFFVLSTMAPLLQKWFAASGDAAANDPYFLYAASNCGSLAALLGYPMLIEPYLAVALQNWVWTIAYVLLVVLGTGCSVLVWRARGDVPSSAPAQDPAEPSVAPAAPAPGQRLLWIALAFVPSSLMLGVTTYLTTDIASMPLLWVIPLSIYLLSFILVFSTIPPIVQRLLQRAMPVVILLWVFSMVAGGRGLVGWSYLLTLAALFVISMVCHGQLARSRPAERHLTGFYLCLSLGGVLGGLFNGLVAPLVFRDVVELPLVLVLACLLRPPGDEENLKNGVVDLAMLIALLLAAVYVFWPASAPGPSPFDVGALVPSGSGWVVAAAVGVLLAGYALLGKGDPGQRWLDIALPLVLAALTAQLILRAPFKSWSLKGSSSLLGVDEAVLVSVLTYGPPLVLCGFFRRPVRIGLGIGGVLLVAAASSGPGNLAGDEPYQTTVVHQERSFFGVMKVVRLERKAKNVRNAYIHSLVHGSTLHGQQRRHADAYVLACGLMPILAHDSLTVATTTVVSRKVLDVIRADEQEPLAYFHRSGPFGQVYDAVCGRRPCHVAFVGLGTGTMASYVEPNQTATFYEIDPAVVDIANNPRFFTYLRDCRGTVQADGQHAGIVLGDARFKLRDAGDGSYRLLVIDAFSSDSIPVHLLTREAIQLYMKKLAPDGVAAFHISNRLLRLEAVLARAAEDQQLLALKGFDLDRSQPGKTPSRWVVLARTWEPLAPLAARPGSFFQPIELDPKQPLWTDDFSSLIGIIRWTK